MKTSAPKVSIYGFCGLAAYGVDQAMNYEFMIGLEGGVTSLVIAVPIAGLFVLHFVACSLALPIEG